MHLCLRTGIRRLQGVYVCMPVYCACLCMCARACEHTLNVWRVAEVIAHLIPSMEAVHICGDRKIRTSRSSSAKHQVHGKSHFLHQRVRAYGYGIGRGQLGLL